MFYLSRKEEAATPSDPSPSPILADEAAVALPDGLPSTVVQKAALEMLESAPLSATEATEELPPEEKSMEQIKREEMERKEVEDRLQTAMELLKDVPLGILKPLMADDSVSDILVNGTKTVYVERAGVLEETDLRFDHKEEVDQIAHHILKALDRDIDTDRPLMDARLPDGSRVNIIMPPMAVDGTNISIRKFPSQKITLDRMVERGVMTAEVAEFLKVCAQQNLSMIVSGGTGSGKTTMLNALSQHISPKERIVTIEDSAELQLQQPHVVRLETKVPGNGDRRGSVSVRDLVRNSLRMRPDRIIVGEVRGAAAFDMMQAMNSGHEGSMATLHANSPRDALVRLENMVNMGEMHLSEKFVRQQIVSALSLVVHTHRYKDGSRRVSHITEVLGMENDIIVTQDLFNFVVSGEDEQGKILGEFRWANTPPRCKALARAACSIGLFKRFR